MNKTQIIIIILFLLLPSFKSGENQNHLPKYKIDRSIKKEVRKNTESINGVPVGNVEMRMFEDDSLIFDNFGEIEKGQLMFMPAWNQDVVEIIGFAGFAVALGFYLDLYKDNYELTYLTKCDSEIYKYNQQDNTLLFKLSVPCSYTSCTLTSKPVFTEGNTISGIVELKSNDFWQVANGRENKYRVELKAYFSLPLRWSEYNSY